MRDIGRQIIDRDLQPPGQQLGDDVAGAALGHVLHVEPGAVLQQPAAHFARGARARRAVVRPARMRYMESILGRLRQAGFSTAMTHHGYHALDSHIMGFTMWEAGIMAGTENLSNAAATFLQGLAADEYPYLIEHIQHHLGPSRPDDVGEFEFGLDLILDGLERTLAPA